MAEAFDPIANAVPRTPGISEIRSGKGHEPFDFRREASGSPGPGIRRVNMRAVIDTSPPFGSVKEAVTRFGGSGPWIPLWKLGDGYHGIEEFDIKRVGEQTAELEKDLIVKELETLDVLEELGSTKRMVEELKRQLQDEASRCFTSVDFNHEEQITTSPTIKEMNNESYDNLVNNYEHVKESLSPCPMSSPDLILMELKQAKLNLGKTITDLRTIQTSVESLNRKMKKDKNLLELSQERDSREIRTKSPVVDGKECKKGRKDSTNALVELQQFNSKTQQVKNRTGRVKSEVRESMRVNEKTRSSLRTAELKWVAAKKMGEAARAAEAVALSEIEAITNSETSLGFALPEPEKINHNFRKPEGFSEKNLESAVLHYDEADTSKMVIVKRLKEATEELNLSKQALEEVFNRVEVANKKQLLLEEAVKRWVPEHTGFHPATIHKCSTLNSLNRLQLVNNSPNPVSKPTTSMRDVLSRKQGTGDEYGETRNEQTENQKVALSDMLLALRDDLTFPSKAEKDGNDQKNMTPERKKFRFIHISLPMTKQSKKKMQASNAL